MDCKYKHLTVCTGIAHKQNKFGTWMCEPCHNKWFQWYKNSPLGEVKK